MRLHVFKVSNKVEVGQILIEPKVQLWRNGTPIRVVGENGARRGWRDEYKSYKSYRAVVF